MKRFEYKRYNYKEINAPIKVSINLSPFTYRDYYGYYKLHNDKELVRLLIEGEKERDKNRYAMGNSSLNPDDFYFEWEVILPNDVYKVTERDEAGSKEK